MSQEEGADSSTQNCENSLTTLKLEENTNNKDVPEIVQPPLSEQTTNTGRRPRFGTGVVPASPFMWIDGKKIRSAIAWTKKQPQRRVSFPTQDDDLVTGYSEPVNPWRYAVNVDREELITEYKESCLRHNTIPLDKVLEQLENFHVSRKLNVFDLKGIILDQDNCETLEEIFKRIPFKTIDLEGTCLNDETSVILFGMFEYYESTSNLNISSNPEIGMRGWQACSNMIRKSCRLKQLEAKDIQIDESNMILLTRALRWVYHLHVLKLEKCKLSGKALMSLVTALKPNIGLKELYLARNEFDSYDAVQLASLVRLNSHLQVLDISNNKIGDDGIQDILMALTNQVKRDIGGGDGLNVLLLWNNCITKCSSPNFSSVFEKCDSLETINMGKNILGNDTVKNIKEALTHNRILLQLGMQSTDVTCEGMVDLAEVIEKNQVLQRIDLRDNHIEMTGMRALAAAMGKNESVTQLDLDDKPRAKIDGTLHQYIELLNEIRSYCSRNKTNALSSIEDPLKDTITNGDDQPETKPYTGNNSRKISLTCQTLPYNNNNNNPSPKTTTTTTTTTDGLLEPKRSSSGRLRSPAPSPIPSPIASPIPSPSRSRFVVSRVSETSLSSTNSSASSSPVTPPSLNSCFFPSSSSSRFRVSVVEQPPPPPPPVPPPVSEELVNMDLNFKLMEEDEEEDDKPNRNLSKLLSLFQHPGQLLFAEAETPVEERVINTTIVGLGEKLHRYMMDGGTKLIEESKKDDEPDSINSTTCNILKYDKKLMNNCNVNTGTTSNVDSYVCRRKNEEDDRDRCNKVTTHNDTRSNIILHDGIENGEDMIFSMIDITLEDKIGMDLRESVDSGIESECSSIVKNDSGMIFSTNDDDSSAIISNLHNENNHCFDSTPSFLSDSTTSDNNSLEDNNICSTS